MFKSNERNNEIVSLIVMLLMAVALVAGQADATIQDEVRAVAEAEVSHVHFQGIFD